MSIDRDSVCEHIAHGKSLISWCKLKDIGYSTVMAHLAVDREFQDNYARAREAQADYLAEEIMEIADEAQTETIVGESNVKYDATAVARNRLRVDTRKWIASKMKPKKYGDKTIHAGDEDAPINVIQRIERAIIDPKHDNA